MTALPEVPDSATSLDYMHEIRDGKFSPSRIDPTDLPSWAVPILDYRRQEYDLVGQVAAVLDRYAADGIDWAVDVSQRDLNLASSMNCVLGQLFGMYGSAEAEDFQAEVLPPEVLVDDPECLSGKRPISTSEAFLPSAHRWSNLWRHEAWHFEISWRQAEMIKAGKPIAAALPND